MFYRDLKPRGAATRRSRVVLDPIKHVLGVFFNGFKNIPGKACVKRVHNNDAFVNVGN